MIQIPECPVYQNNCEMRYWRNAPEQEAGSSPDDPIFKVINAAGDTVFAVYPEGVRINVGAGTVKGNKGGFAVGGLSSASKLGQSEFLRVKGVVVRFQKCHYVRG